MASVDFSRNASFGIKGFEMFFDRTAVENAIGRYERKVLSGTGSFGRRVMRNSIRKAPKQRRGRTRVRIAGKPPRYHVHRNTGLRLILFEYNPNVGSVVIGPLKFRRFRRSGAESFSRGRRTRIQNTSGKPVPQLVNEGGNGRKIIEYKSGHTYTRPTVHRAFPYRDLALLPTVAKMREIMDKTELK